jgi:hypothetical protein
MLVMVGNRHLLLPPTGAVKTLFISQQAPNCQHLSKLLVPQRMAAIFVKDSLARLNKMRITSVLVVRVA